MNRARITREAVCSQDDQMNDIEMILDVLPSKNLKELIDKIVESRFLQFSIPALLE